MIEKLNEILDREIKRFDVISQDRPLTSEEIKDVESLVRSLKAFKSQEKKVESPLDALSSDDLLRLIKGDFTNGGATES
jgi:hypothetical protein